MITIEQNKKGVVIETELMTVRIFENVNWKSGYNTDVINFCSKEDAWIDFNHTSGDYGGDIRIIKVK